MTASHSESERSRKTEVDKVMEVMAQTKGNPQERDRRLTELAENRSVAAGIVCKCQDDADNLCPMHGRK